MNIKNDIMDIIKKIINVKSIVTFALTAVVCYSVIVNNIALSGEFFASIVGAVITYYFTRQDKTK